MNTCPMAFRAPSVRLPVSMCEQFQFASGVLGNWATATLTPPALQVTKASDPYKHWSTICDRWIPLAPPLPRKIVRGLVRVVKAALVVFESICVCCQLLTRTTESNSRPASHMITCYRSVHEFPCVYEYELLDLARVKQKVQSDRAPCLNTIIGDPAASS